jgi:hypothetical protein
MHDLQLERRNLIKKTQECDELKDKINIYQQKCENNDFKLEERDNIIQTLNTKLTQMEIEMMRLGNEFDKMRAANLAKSSKYSNFTRPILFYSLIKYFPHLFLSFKSIKQKPNTTHDTSHYRYEQIK